MGDPHSHFLSLTFPHIPHLPFRQIQLGGLGSAVISRSEVWGKAQPKLNLVHFSYKIWHLVTAVSMIFMRLPQPAIE